MEWKLKSPLTGSEDLIIGTAEGKPIAPENLRRAMSEAKANEAKRGEEGGARDPLDVGEARLSLHSLRHSFGSMVATDLQLAPTTVAQLLGHYLRRVLDAGLREGRAQRRRRWSHVGDTS